MAPRGPERAIVAGRGVLPDLLLEAGPAYVVAFAGVPVAAQGAGRIDARFERLGQLFADLAAAGVRDVCFAGAMTRPPLDPAAMDEVTKALVPRLMQAMSRGDDALLRDVAALFEERGLAVLGAREVRGDLVARPGRLAGAPLPEADVARARAVLDALGPLDVGQGAVAARGQVLGIETLQGTDAMLRFVAETAPDSGGVLVKRPKAGQDLRLDMPAIGPETVRAAARAGLRGIEISAGEVLLLGPDEVLAACAETGLSLWAAP
ncbi:UDP-2,3-diacylglucosamine diphosphatase LpxI [Roseibacterium sp. SDUM158017]|uniref:LpxI family protein n=1 Tax=Roseicyclus salinarum TaxID=3036773 RepID=UPI0024156ED6|nr:UDP-2,3-diacylglucosamine diphosphatase LpxI [Roseibacterium sp. SDUM158017]MDG4648374.1 UDP-2,3-diacylglucosamine diphosphatase LpxI [Roseibacterium sp. SDUM158017]